MHDISQPFLLSTNIESIIFQP